MEVDVQIQKLLLIGLTPEEALAARNDPKVAHRFICQALDQSWSDLGLPKIEGAPLPQIGDGKPKKKKVPCQICLEQGDLHPVDPSAYGVSQHLFRAHHSSMTYEQYVAKYGDPKEAHAGKGHSG